MLPQQTTTVGFALIGCGYMGGNGLAAVRTLSRFATSEYSMVPILLLDRKLDVANRALARCIEYGIGDATTIKAISNEKEAWRHIYTWLRENDAAILLYDATPPQHRLGNLARLVEVQGTYLAARTSEDRQGDMPFEPLNSRAFFLGEKPFALTHEELQEVKELSSRIALGCELIEAVNPAFQALKAYVEQERLSIRSMWFWRAGSMGAECYANGPRDGVQGGSLLDKAPHDLSISVNLLGPEGVSGRVDDARIHYLTPWSASDDQAAFLSCVNRKVEHIATDLYARELLPADSLSSLDVRWTTESCPEGIPAEYLFSWAGLTTNEREHAFRTELSSLGYNDADYVFTRVEGYVGHEEVRMGVIECGDRTIVCNFLEKQPQDGTLAGARTVTRFVHVHWRGGDRIALQLDYDPLGVGDVEPRDKKESELAAVFDIAIRAQLGLGDARMIGQDVTLATHEVLLAAQDRAIRNLEADLPRKNSSVWLEQARRHLETKLVRSGTSQRLAES